VATKLITREASLTRLAKLICQWLLFGMTTPEIDFPELQTTIAGDNSKEKAKKYSPYAQGAYYKAFGYVYVLTKLNRTCVVNIYREKPLAFIGSVGREEVKKGVMFVYEAE
jgi:hypothetical protein